MMKNFAFEKTPKQKLGKICQMIKETLKMN